MTKTIKHDGNWICNVFGLGNNNALCYLNSLTQALASCPSFLKTLKEREQDYKTKSESLGAILTSVLMPRLATADTMVTVAGAKIYKKVKVESTRDIFSAIQKARVNRKATLVSGQHEDVFEGFKFLMEELGDPFLQHFYTRYKTHIRCMQCRTKRDVDQKACPPEIMINMSESDPILQTNLDSQEEIQKFIKLHMLYPDDYKCDDCSAKNNLKAVPPNHPVQQFYALGRVSSTIVMSFHDKMRVLFDNASKPADKRETLITRFFPNELRIDTKSTTLVYRVVAQIEHLGNLQGGHYIAKCLRPRPHGFSELRLDAAKKALADSHERLRSCQDQARIQTLETKVRNAQKTIDEETLLTTMPDVTIDSLDLFIKKYYAVFKFNDRDVTYDVKGFVPNPNTYLVFYHLFQELPL